MYSSNFFKHPEGMKNNILFLHLLYHPFADKKKSFKLVLHNEKLQEVVQVFLNDNARPDEIVDAEQQFLVVLYGGKSENSSDALR